jgi:hypothetical protein
VTCGCAPKRFSLARSLIGRPHEVHRRAGGSDAGGSVPIRRDKHGTGHSETAWKLRRAEPAALGKHFFAYTIPTPNNGYHTSMDIELLDEDRPALAALTGAIKSFLDTGAAPVLLPIFFLVARYPNRTCAELAKLQEISLSTMSRHLLLLGHGSLALIQTRAEAGDARYIRHSLTDQGVALLKRMVGRSVAGKVSV